MQKKQRNVLVEMEKISNRASGLGQFCFNLGEQYQKINPHDIALDFYVPAAQRNIFGNGFKYTNKNSFHKFIPLNSSRYDVWHCMHQGSKYMPASKNTKLILTIHDLNFLNKYTGIKRNIKLKFLQSLVNRCSAITVISKFTESEIKKYLNIQVPVHVIYNGNSLKESTATPTINITAFKNYFFSIGIISEKKNFHVLLPLLESFPDMQLVIAGNNSSAYAKQILNEAKTKNVYNRLHLIGNVDENNKYHLYKNCKALLFPSCTEGFGLPVIEAMSLGKPVFLSNLTSLPEIGGSEAYYWNNFESTSMAQIVKTGLTEYSNTPDKTKRIRAWAQQFSWENAANAYLNLYKTT